MRSPYPLRQRGRLRTNSIQPHQPPAANGNAPPQSQQPQQPQQPPHQSQQPPHPPKQACQPPGPPAGQNRSTVMAEVTVEEVGEKKKKKCAIERSPTSPTKRKHHAVGWPERGGAGKGTRSARSKNASC